MAKYRIVRPPLLGTFELPSREELMHVGIGDNVKLIFSAFGKAPDERMWVKVTSTKNPLKWEGTLSNTPVSPVGIKYKDKVVFHPLDIIGIYEGDKSVPSRLPS